MDPDGVIAGLRAELDRIPLATEPLAHATASYRLAMALAERPHGDRRANLTEAAAHHARALTVFTRAFPRERARVLTGLGAAERALGMLTIARDRFAEAVHLLDPLPGVSEELAAALNNLGLVQGDLGNHGQAREAFERALSILDATSDRRLRATTLHNLGLVLAGRGDVEAIREAVDVQRRAIAVADPLDSAYVWASAQQALGVALMSLPGARREHLAEARRAFVQALGVFRLTEFPFQHAITKNNLGLAHMESAGDDPTSLRAAVAAFEDALAVFDPRIHRELWKEARANLEGAMSLLAGMGEPMEPEEHFARLLAAVESGDSYRLMRERLRRLLTLPEPGRSRLLGRWDRALVELEPPALDHLTVMWMRVLMEQPHPQVVTALQARVSNLADLDAGRRNRAAWALERAVGDLEVIQRVRIRELLAGMGFERPDPP